MESFFSTNRINWLPMDSVFGNMRNYENNHAFMRYEPSELLSVCLDNCTEFEQPDLCQDYCYDVFQSGVASTATNYPCTDWRCCKRQAGTNDFMYIGCMEAVKTTQKWKPANHFLFLFFFLLVMIKCVSTQVLIP